IPLELQRHHDLHERLWRRRGGERGSTAPRSSKEDTAVSPPPWAALSGHASRALPCLLLGVKRTLRGSASMSAFGTKRTSQPPRSMSAFGGKADIKFLAPNVCF